MSVLQKVLPIIIVCCLVLSCKQGPKIIPLEDSELMKPTLEVGPFNKTSTQDNGMTNPGSIDQDIHTVVAQEILPTKNYVYIKVVENDRTYWIATKKTEVLIGTTYIYKGSVLQSNFKSEEYNRLFEEVYFVEEIIPFNHGDSFDDSIVKRIANQTDAATGITSGNISVEGSMKISELVADPDKYGGRFVQISGICTKVNANIMGLNWIHLKDGSQDDYDLVVTSDTIVDVGEIVTFNGIVGLDRNFGAGYFYNIIIEGGELITEE